ncbi:hypothetical protein LguiB_030602 [Lonicera macranthoides]
MKDTKSHAGNMDNAVNTKMSSTLGNTRSLFKQTKNADKTKTLQARNFQIKQ